jgi:hypothetical protein
MYKTVRHGENSIQYTILPQQDDSAVVTAANISICGRSRAGARRKARRGRKVTILIMALILACGVVGAAVVVPLLVSPDLVTIPSAIQRFSNHKNGRHYASHHTQYSAILQNNMTSSAHQNTTLWSAAPELATSEDMFSSSTHKNELTSTSVSQSLLPEENIATTKKSVTLLPVTEEVTMKATTHQEAPVEVERLLEENGGAKRHDHFGGSKKKALDQDVRNSTSTLLLSATTVRDNRSVSMLEGVTEAAQDVGESPESPKQRLLLVSFWRWTDPLGYLRWEVSLSTLFHHHHLHKCMSLCTFLA